MNGDSWSAALLTEFRGIGFKGSDLPNLCNAIGLGSAQHVSGKSFSTTDTGLVPGAGVGSGVGVTGIIESVVAQKIHSLSVSKFSSEGSRLMDTCTVIAKVLVQQMGLAALTSINSPVFSGQAIIVPGSIAVNGDAWGSAIAAAAPSFKGKHWANWANAIGGGCAFGFQTATGLLTISGSGSNPVPGGGSGIGQIV